MCLSLAGCERQTHSGLLNWIKTSKRICCPGGPAQTLTDQIETGHTAQRLLHACQELRELLRLLQVYLHVKYQLHTINNSRSAEVIPNGVSDQYAVVPGNTLNSIQPRPIQQLDPSPSASHIC